MRKYNRNNCDNRLRAVITDKFGRTVALFGKHAFEWEIVLEEDGRTIIWSFKSRIDATREFNKYKRKR